jgi:rhomboid protease GluP
VVYKKIPNDMVTYEAKIKDFVSMEAMALEVFKLPENTPNDKILYELKDRGVYYWYENIRLLESLNELDLPQEIRTRNKLLTEYCELRIKSYEMIYRTISENTDKYKSEISFYNREIEEKIKQIGSGQQTQ